MAICDTTPGKAEAKADACGEGPYVSETFGLKTTRFRIDANKDLSQRETCCHDTAQAPEPEPVFPN